MEGKSDLPSLIARVEGATGAGRELFLTIARELIGDAYSNATDWRENFNALLGVGAWTDAALALCERVLLPELMDIVGSWEPHDKGVWPAWSVRWYPAGTARDGKSWHAQFGKACTPALALLAAMLRALAAQAPNTTPDPLHADGEE